MIRLDLKKSRSLMNVRRLNYERCNRYENVAEHSYYVGIMAYQIAQECGFDESDARYCLKMGLMHDLPEAVTGDIPFLVRRALGDVTCTGLDDMGAKEIGVDLGTDRTTIEIVNLADILEFAVYLQEEVFSGNRSLVAIYRETLGRLVGYLEVKGYKSYILKVLDETEEAIRSYAKELPDAIKH